MRGFLEAAVVVVEEKERREKVGFFGEDRERRVVKGVLGIRAFLA